MVTANNIQVVVLLGGLGTRLGDAAANVPKPMVDVNGKPFFYYQLKLMKSWGFNEYLFCIGYKGSIIEKFFKDGSGYGVKIRYSYDGEKLLGTAGALRKALPMLKPEFLVMYGDSFMDFNYDEMLYRYSKEREEKDISGLMTVFRNLGRYDKSNVVFRNSLLLRYDKENSTEDMEYIDYGISVLKREVIEEVEPDCKRDLAGIYTNLVDIGDMIGFEVGKRFYEIGTPKSLGEFRSYSYERFLKSKPALFIDRDGTLNQIVYNDDTELIDSPLNPEQLKLIPGTIEALRVLKSLGYLLIIVTNQPAAAKGKTTLGNIYDTNRKLLHILNENNAEVDDILICPHHPDKNPNTENENLNIECSCRKPKPGLIMKAFKKYNIDTDMSYMVGDSHVDMLAGHAAGIKGVFIGKYKCDICQLMGDIKPALISGSLYEFALKLQDLQKEGI